MHTELKTIKKSICRRISLYDPDLRRILVPGDDIRDLYECLGGSASGIPCL